MPVAFLRNQIIGAFGITTFEKSTAKQAKQANNYIKKVSINNPLVSAISRNYRRGVIQTGITIKSKTGDAKFNEKFNKYIVEFGRKASGGRGRSNCDISGKTYLSEFERIVVDEYAVKTGGVLVAHHYSSSFPMGYKYEMIPIYMINTTAGIVENEINGFRYNKWGEITHINLYNDQNRKKSSWKDYNNFTLLVNKWADPFQYTPLSPIVSIMESLDYIDNYKSNEMEGAGFRAKTPLLIKTPYFTQIMKSIKDKFKSPIDSIKFAFSQRRLDKREMQGGFSYIADDEEVIETGRSVDSIYNDMYTNEGRAISVGVGLSSSSVIGEKSSSYNAALKDGKSEELEYDIVFQDIVEGLFREMIEFRLLNGLIYYAKKLDIPNFSENASDFRKVKFTRKELGHIDPTKTAKALTENVNVNQSKTMQEALEERGVDYEDYLVDKKAHELNILKMKIEVKKKYDEAGVEYPFDKKEKVK